jgi:cytoskeletal protein RodZ
MSSVAEQLRAGREARSLTIHQVADATMIKTEHIRSLEGGDYSPFSAPVYIRGHVKALARVLHLDPNTILGQLDRELSQTEEFSAPPSLSPRRKGALDWVMLQISKMHLQVLAPFVLLVALLGAIVWGYTIWRQNQATDPLKDLGAGIYQGQLQIGGQYLPLPADATNQTTRP